MEMVKKNGCHTYFVAFYFLLAFCKKGYRGCTMTCFVKPMTLRMALRHIFDTIIVFSTQLDRLTQLETPFDHILG
jgi:hypothetical protein